MVLSRHSCLYKFLSNNKYFTVFGKVFFFSKASRLAMRPTQTPILWVEGFFLWEKSGE
jgi:hypothetical protein